MNLPPNAKHRGTYLGLNVVLTKEVATRRDELCARFNLIPQSELHLTIAYLGPLCVAALADMVDYLRGIKSDIPKRLSLAINGPWVAERYQERFGQGLGVEGLRYVRKPEELQQHPARFGFWSVQSDPLFGKLWKRFWSAVKRSGSEREPGTQASPHITLGRACDDDAVMNAYRRRLERLPKQPIIDDVSFPVTVEVDRLHITNGRLQPRSLAVVWRFDAPRS